MHQDEMFRKFIVYALMRRSLGACRLGEIFWPGLRKARRDDHGFRPFRPWTMVTPASLTGRRDIRRSTCSCH